MDSRWVLRGFQVNSGLVPSGFQVNSGGVPGGFQIGSGWVPGWFHTGICIKCLVGPHFGGSKNLGSKNLCDKHF